MAEYITKEQALETLCEKCPVYNCILPCHTHNAIKNLPTVDVVPVIHAKWEMEREIKLWKKLNGDMLEATQTD